MKDGEKTIGDVSSHESSWAEVFHLQEIRWDRPRFLSKSFLGFVTFNVISYSLLIAELLLIWFGQEHLHFYTHIFNGCYAVLMFIVVIFFLIYGVEVFFKVILQFYIRVVSRCWKTPQNSLTFASEFIEILFVHVTIVLRLMNSLSRNLWDVVLSVLVCVRSGGDLP